jgi:hypothetical protein
LYEKAVAWVAGRLPKLREGDTVAVVFATRPHAQGPFGRLISAGEARQGDLATRLKASKPTDLRADFPAALKAVADLLAPSGEVAARLSIVSDFRRGDFTGGEAAGALRRAFAALDPKRIEVSLLDFGLPCRNNLTVENVVVGRHVVVAGVSTPVRVTIRNTGQDATAPTQLEAVAGGSSLPTQPVPGLAPGEVATVELPCTFDAPGGAWVRVALPADDLPGDSAFVLALEVREALRVLILDGSANPTEPESASFALAHALDPSGQAAFGRRVDVQAAAAWNPASLTAYDVVILTNVREFAVSRDAGGGTIYPGLRALEDYVKAGGGLAIFVGSDLSPAFYNGPFHADGQGLSPLLLAERAPAAPDPERFVRLNPESVADTPMLRVFSSRGANFSQFVRFHAHVAASAPAFRSAGASDAPRILAAFDNGLPAVCRRSYGKGEVIMWYSSADTKWTNWPRDLSFLPVVNDMAWELARVAENPYADVVVRRLAYALPDRLAGAAAAVLKTPAYPADDVQVLALEDDGGRRTVGYPRPPLAGLYELTVTLSDRTEHRVFFSRHTDPRESDLAQARESELRAAVGGSCRYVGGMAAQPAEDGDAASLKSFWWLFLAGLLAVMALETGLALRFGHYQRGARADSGPAR